VVDAADPDFVAQQATVGSVLEQLGAASTPRITVFNKIDLLGDPADSADAARPDGGQHGGASNSAVFVSATRGIGLDALRVAIAGALRDGMVAVDALIPYQRGALVTRAKTAGEVTERYLAGGIRIKGRLPSAIAAEVSRSALSRGPRAS
jgi:GTP-binding protein HflX